MENWAPAIYDDVPRRAIPLPPVSEVYLKYGLNVCRADGETTFSLCRDTVSTLINTLGRTFKDVRRTIEDDSVDFATAVESIADSLLFLCYVVDHKDVQRVFTHTTLTRVLDPKYFRDHTKNVAQALEDGWDPPTTADCEDDSDYALRYLRMLTSSATAVLSVASPNTLRLLAAAKVTVISLLKPPHAPDSACDRVTQSVVDVIQRRLTSGSEVCEEAMKWVRDLAARKSDHESSCHVHAEAGVMALACDTSACRKGHGECEMVNPEVTICVAPGQRCCALCFRLGELLNARLGTNLQFRLPGTHDVILPWDPPLFGIPKSVMRQLRDELRDTLADVTIQVAKRNVSIRNSAFRRT
ncbi:hypothetical protein LXA43DRAFT_749798 [Ganoderma leucocontextum]|nr:hypothetical protein LXA43DRAFT_749798 [Ganoderma leucocontextum]